MKKIICILSVLSLLLVSLMPCALAAEEPIPLLTGTTAQKTVSIVLSKDAPETERYAADTLKAYLNQVTGEEYSIITDEKAPEDFALYVGNTAFTQSKTAGLADGSYFIKSTENGIEIAGAGNRGTIYGVYRFLEESAGFRAYTAEMGFVTRETTVDFLQNYNISYTPYFEYTDTDWHSPCDITYSLANGLNGSPYRSLSEEQGGSVGYISGFCHTLSTQFCSADQYFDEHPEYFALRDGKRVKDQLCLTDENVYNIVLEEVLALIKEKHNPDEEVQIVSLTQNDNRNYCQCENCKKLDEENGSQSGTIITFVNRIAEQVEKAGYHNIAIDTFAYQYSRKAPTKVKPHSNVIVRLCTIECCFAHALNDEACEENADLMYDLNEWSKICNRIYVWDYTTNYAHTVGIFPDFQVLQQNMQCFYEHGVKGVYEEGAYYVDYCNAEFGELRAYLLARLLQNPYCDFDKETEGFLNAYYGDGGQYIGQFLDKIAENAVKQHAGIYAAMTSAFSLTEEEAKDCDYLWSQAKEKANSEEILEHINRSELSWRYVKSSLGLTDFSGFGKINANKALYADLQKFGITMFSEGDDDAQVPYFYFLSPAQSWRENESMLLPLHLIACILYAVVLILALLRFIKGLKLKKYAQLVAFPLLAVFIEVVLWNRRAYLAWRDIDEYVITVVLFAIVSFVVGLTAQMLYNQSKRKTVLLALLRAVIFMILNEIPLLVINVLIFNGRANTLAMAVSLMLCAGGLLVNEITAFKKLCKK